MRIEKLEGHRVLMEGEYFNYLCIPARIRDMECHLWYQATLTGFELIMDVKKIKKLEKEFNEQKQQASEAERTGAAIH